jgi:integrase
LRPEEYLGLPRHNLELVEGGGAGRRVARIRQVAVKIRGGGWIFPTPKTKKGIRDVPFLAHLYRELSRLEVLNDSRRRLAGTEWQDFDLVFPSRDGTPQGEAWLLNRRFRPFLRRAGLPQHLTLYSLRYTYATLQLLAGERDKVVSDLMGHTQVNFTKDVYTKVLPVMQEEASDRLENLFFGAFRTTPAQSASELPM